MNLAARNRCSKCGNKCLFCGAEAEPTVNPLQRILDEIKVLDTKLTPEICAKSGFKLSIDEPWAIYTVRAGGQGIDVSFHRIHPDRSCMTLYSTELGLDGHWPFEKPAIRNLHAALELVNKDLRAAIKVQL